MFWIILVLVVLFIGYVFDTGTGRPSGASKYTKGKGYRPTQKPRVSADLLHRPPSNKELIKPFQDKVKDSEITKALALPLAEQVRKLDSSVYEGVIEPSKNIAEFYNSGFLLAGKNTEVVSKGNEKQRTSIGRLFEELDRSKQASEKLVPHRSEKEISVPVFAVRQETKQALAKLMRENEIKAFVEKNSIPFLTHFTDFRNLSGVMSQGLVPRAVLEAKGLDFIYNDEVRLDGVKGSISASIAFPNYKMFYKYRCTSPARNWVVLIIDKSVLWESECLFFKHNAADKRMIFEDRKRLAQVAALSGVYDDEVGDIQRDNNLLKPYDPTDPQAEVLVLSSIPPDKIRTVVFDSIGAREWFSRRYPLQKAVCDTAFFSSREYARRKRVI